MQVLANAPDNDLAYIALALFRETVGLFTNLPSLVSDIRGTVDGIDVV